MDRAIVSRRGAARWVGRQHPWIYASDVVERPSAAAGAVSVADEGGKPIGVALWSPSSTISLRMLTRGTESIGPDFWCERVEAAVRYRRSLDPDASAYRLVHGEADGLPSLVVDRYGDYLIVQLLSAGVEAFRHEITDALSEVLAPKGILARNDVPVRRHEALEQRCELLEGEVPEEIEVREADVRCRVAPWTGQKTGAFLDQRENRVRAGELAYGRVLDCFTYHGSFALHVARRATAVTAIDGSGAALERAAANAALNGLSNVALVEANVFDYLRAEEAAGARYDAIVLDPPAFAKRRDALDQAVRGYKEINLRAMRLLAPGGLLFTFSCSFHLERAAFRRVLESAAQDAGRAMRWVEAREQSADHPQILQIPESSYLKGAILQAFG